VTAAECVVNEYNESECECQPCTNIGMDPVCGYVVLEPRGQAYLETWISECHLLRYACENEVYDYELVNSGACGGMCLASLFYRCKYAK